MAKTPETIEGISSVDRESIKPGEIGIDASPREWRPVGIGKGKDGNYLLVLEKTIDPQVGQEGLRAVLEEHPNYEGELLVGIGACLEKNEGGYLVAKLLEDKKGIWRVLRSDCHMEVYRTGGDMAYDVTIRTLAYERARLAPVVRAFPELFGAGN